MIYDLARRPNEEIEHALGARRLRSFDSFGTGKRLCLFEGANSSSEGLGKNRRNSMASSKFNNDIHLLGRSPEQTSLLSRDASYVAVGQSLRLFVPQHIIQSIPVDGVERKTDEARYISMVVRLANKKNLLCDTLGEKLKGLSAIRAVNYLNYSFDAGFEEIEMNEVKTSPTAMMGDLPGLQTVPACEVAPISFWGGPPNKRTWYAGSLLTLLVDRIMRATDAGNLALLGRFLNLTV